MVALIEERDGQRRIRREGRKEGRKKEERRREKQRGKGREENTRQAGKARQGATMSIRLSYRQASIRNGEPRIMVVTVPLIYSILFLGPEF